MKKGTLIALAVVLALLAVLLVRAGSEKMAAPWPQKVTVEEKTPVKNDFGVVVSEETKSTPKWSYKGFWTWIGAFLTLCILSFLYKDNPFYKFAEHLFVGVSAAYWMVMGVWTTLVPNLFGKLTPALVSGVIEGVEGNRPDIKYIIPLVFGLLLLTRLVESVGVYSRWALAFIVGTTAGLNFVQYLMSDFMSQIASSIVPLVARPEGAFSWAATLGNIVIFVGVLCGLIYFFFSKEHTGVFGAASRVGIWVLMVSFGASFGFTVMGRIALLVGRLEYLMRDWLQLMSG